MRGKQIEMHIHPFQLTIMQKHMHQFVDTVDLGKYYMCTNLHCVVPKALIFMMIVVGELHEVQLESRHKKICESKDSNQSVKKNTICNVTKKTSCSIFNFKLKFHGEHIFQ